jgi:hypothetical protein
MRGRGREQQIEEKKFLSGLLAPPGHVAQTNIANMSNNFTTVIDVL